MPTPELAAHSADTGTSEFSVVSPASEQPGSSQSVWPSPSLSSAVVAGALGARGRRRRRRRGRGGRRRRAGRSRRRPRERSRRAPGAGALGAGCRGRRRGRAGRARPPRPPARSCRTASPPARARAPCMSALPFRRLPSSAPSSPQPGALPPSSAFGNVLTPLSLPPTVNTTLPGGRHAARAHDRHREPPLLHAAGDGHARGRGLDLHRLRAGRRPRRRPGPRAARPPRALWPRRRSWISGARPASATKGAGRGACGRSYGRLARSASGVSLVRC